MTSSRQRLGELRLRARDLRHWLQLRRMGARRPAEYRDYLAVQLRRTLSKRGESSGIGSRLLISRTIDALGAPADARILCVGCRNGAELDEFRARGARDVVGIDLFSQRDDILVMDMHAMTFGDDSFDAVYCSHALEHSYDVPSVASEIERVGRDDAVVALEVPIRISATAADRIVFAGVDDLRRAFEPHVGEVLLSEEEPPLTETNEQGTEIARLVFRLRKRD